MNNVLDPKNVRIKEIRKMAGRAFLDGPHTYNVADIEGPLLDLAVANGRGLKAVIYLVDNAISPFYECSVLNELGRLQYQFTPSRAWHQGGYIIEEEKISIISNPFGGWDAHIEQLGELFCHDAPLVAAMRMYVYSKFGDIIIL